MRVGLPKGLLFYRYSPFFTTFFTELGAEIAVSGDTSKAVLDAGVRHCVDDACLPVKVFHGHAASLANGCDLLVVPRFMRIREREFICPKFCGLPEMVTNSVPGLPPVTAAPIYAQTEALFYRWAKETGALVTRDRARVKRAFSAALDSLHKHRTGIRDRGYPLTVALLGHPYNVYDTFVNMDLVNKLHGLGVGVITEENLNEMAIDAEAQRLDKRPFWTFAKNAFGFAVHMAENGLADGLIYVSSFACGIDSVVTERIKLYIGETPYLVLKLDEHTGEAGVDTRIEAFADMLRRRKANGAHVPASGQRVSRGQGAV